MGFKVQVLGMSLLASVSALAATESAPTVNNVSSVSAAPKSGESTAATTSFSADSVLKALKVGFFTNYHGAPIGDMSSKYTPGKNGVTKTSQGTYFDSTLAVGYRITKNIEAGPDLAFFYTPVLGQGFDMQYTGLRIANHHLIQTDQLNVSANIIFQVANADYLKSIGVKYGIKTTPSAFYRFKGTNLSLGVFTEAKSYIGENIQGKNFKLWALPNVTYDFNDSVGVSLGYEMEAHHKVGNQIMAFDNYQTDLQPGLRWKISKAVLFNPYVMLYTGDKISVHNTGVGAVLVASIL